MVETLETLLIQKGNIKIPKSTAIFNMGSGKYCTSRHLGLCAAQKCGVKCYAIKAEYMYPPVLPFRIRQTKFWKRVTAEQFIEQFITINDRKVIKFNALRLNEAGDFHDQKCVEKAEKIAKALKKHGVTVYCYTSRSDLNYSKVKNLVISGSGFKKSGIKSIFKIVRSLDEVPKNFKVCGGDCSICSRCLNSNMNTCVMAH